MSIIQEKYNIRFDFEESLNIPIDDRVFREYDLNHKSFVANYISIAGGQLFDAKKTVYKFMEGDFYLTVYYEQMRLGLLFIPDEDTYTDDYLEKLRIYCNVKKIKLVIVHLYSKNKSVFPQKVDDFTIALDISGKDSLDVLDEKIKQLMSELITQHTTKYLSSRKAELYENIDKMLCYRLGILLSIQPKKRPENIKIVHGKAV